MGEGLGVDDSWDLASQEQADKREGEKKSCREESEAREGERERKTGSQTSECKVRPGAHVFFNCTCVFFKDLSCGGRANVGAWSSCVCVCGWVLFFMCRVQRILM